MKPLWDYLKNFPKLDKIVDLKLGVQNEPKHVTPRKDYKNTPFKNSVPAITQSKKGFYQYQALRTLYIPSDPKYRRKRAPGAWNYDWHIPKIVLTLGRISAGPWKIAAAIDFEKRYVTRNFYAGWPKVNDVSLYTIAALLNSPIAAAYTYAHSSGGDIRKRVFDQIPIPHNLSESDARISQLVKLYQKNIEHSADICRDILLQIDAELLSLYNLPPRLERQLLNLFWNHNRPVPFDFNGYIPLDNKSWVPLKLYISEQYQNSSLKNQISSLPKITNRDVLDFLQDMGTESE